MKFSVLNSLTLSSLSKPAKMYENNRIENLKFNASEITSSVP